jgi:hypothetical protein
MTTTKQVTDLEYGILCIAMCGGRVKQGTCLYMVNHVCDGIFKIQKKSMIINRTNVGISLLDKEQSYLYWICIRNTISNDGTIAFLPLFSRYF